jgi:hypothetical protein
MAFRYAVATGNWSNTATWDGGTLPTAADDVFSNNFTVTIDGTFTVLSIRNTLNAAAPVIAAGGQFRYANGGNLTCTASPAIVVGSTTPTLEMTLASGNTATFNGSVLTMTSTNNYNAIKLSGTGTLNLNGNYNINTGSAITQVIYVTANGILNIVGDLSSSNTAASNAANVLRVDSISTINVTGNVTTNATVNGFNNVCPINLTAACTLNITGNVTGGVTPVIFVTSSATINIIGNVLGSAQPAIGNTTTASTISVTGITTAGSSAPAIYSSFALISGYGSGTFVKVSGNVVNTSNNMAIVAPRVTIDTNTSSWLYQISTGGNRTLYAAGVALGNPATTNVRFGTTYGASSELTGTLRVPSSANVLSGVLTDNTTGTLLMTPADFWNYLIASGFTANSIGDRLQNASTVATTGGQIAAYTI